MYETIDLKDTLQIFLVNQIFKLSKDEYLNFFFRTASVISSTDDGFFKLMYCSAAY